MAREGSTASDARDRRRYRPKDDMWRCFVRLRRDAVGVGLTARFRLHPCRQGMGGCGRPRSKKKKTADTGAGSDSAAAEGIEDGEVGCITNFGSWADFVFQFRLLTRFLWYQSVRDEYSKRWRQVHQLHSRRTVALARLHRGESLSYHRGLAAVDEKEIKDERVRLCCAAVQMLPFDASGLAPSIKK